MDPARFDQHLSQISTMWTVLKQAHEGPADVVGAAQRRLVERYSPAIYRYLVGALRDPDAAADLFQEFALRFVRGDFKRADPRHGRFRAFLKTSLYHLIVDYQRRKRPLPLEGEACEPAAEAASLHEADRDFLTAWRAELLNRAWQALARFEQETGQPVHTVLRYRTDHPDERSPQMAERLAATLGRAVTPEWVRKRLFLAREKFADMLLEEVAESLDSATEEDLTQELIDLGLLDYCRPALQRRFGGTEEEG